MPASGSCRTSSTRPSSTRAEPRRRLTRLLAVGLLYEAKGYELLLEAVARLAAEGRAFHLDVVGDGPNRAAYEDLAVSLGVADRITFHGLKTKEEVAAFMRSADLFVLTSRYDNNPCVLIEAMASGLPVVATAVGGIPEIVDPGSGRLATPNDPGSIATEIAAALDGLDGFDRPAIARSAEGRLARTRGPDARRCLLRGDPAAGSRSGSVIAMDGTRVAVVVPCFDDGETLADALASLRDQEPHELVVVDDGSSDPSTLAVLEGVERDGIRVIRQENGGLSAARMTGVRATSARYVMPLDADDALAPGSLAALADALDREPAAVMAWGDIEIWGDVELRLKVGRRLDPWQITHREYAAGGLDGPARRRVLAATVGSSNGYEDARQSLDVVRRARLDRHLRPRVMLRYRRTGEQDARGLVIRPRRSDAQLGAPPRAVEQRRRNWLGSSAASSREPCSPSGGSARADTRTSRASTLYGRQPAPDRRDPPPTGDQGDGATARRRRDERPLVTVSWPSTTASRS